MFRHSHPEQYCCNRLNLWWQHPTSQPPSTDKGLWDTIVTVEKWDYCAEKKIETTVPEEDWRTARLYMALTDSPSPNWGHPRLAETKPWLWWALHCQVQASTSQINAQTGQGTARISAQQLSHMKDKARNRRGNKLNTQIHKPQPMADNRQ